MVKTKKRTKKKLKGGTNSNELSQTSTEKKPLFDALTLQDHIEKLQRLQYVLDQQGEDSSDIKNDIERKKAQLADIQNVSPQPDQRNFFSRQVDEIELLEDNFYDKGPDFGSFSTHECGKNPDTSVKLITGHGNLISGLGFRIGKGKKIITLSSTNVCIKIARDKSNIFPMLKYYLEGKTIFKNNDNQKVLDQNAYDLIEKYRLMGLNDIYLNDENAFNYQYGLHLEGELFPETLIQLKGERCSMFSNGFDCSIICFEKDKGIGQELLNFVPSEKNLTGHQGEGINTTIKLSELMKHLGNGTYILFTCRMLDKPSDEAYALTKNLSIEERFPGFKNQPVKQPTFDPHIGRNTYGLDTVPDVRPLSVEQFKMEELKEISIEEDIILSPFNINDFEYKLLTIWLHSNNFVFYDKKRLLIGDEIESKNKRVLTIIMSNLKGLDPFIYLHDIIEHEIINKSKTKHFKDFMRNVGIDPTLLYKIPEILMKLCGRDLKIYPSIFVDRIIDTVDHFSRQGIHPFKYEPKKQTSLRRNTY